jgi:uncharacterized membrane protein YccF (DUF307 family)
MNGIGHRLTMLPILLMLLMNVQISSASYRSVSWYINSIIVKDIPRNFGFNHYLASRMTGPEGNTSIQATLDKGWSTSFSICTFISPNNQFSESECLYMGRADNALLESNVFHLDFYDYSQDKDNRSLVVSFDVSSAAVECRSYCLSKGYRYKNKPSLCSCPAVHLTANFTSQNMTLSFIPGMYLHEDGKRIFLEICIPIISGLSFLFAILDKLVFSPQYPWKYVLPNMLYLLSGGLGTALSWLIVGCCAKYLFRDQEYVRLQFTMIRFQFAPFGKELEKGKFGYGSSQEAFQNRYKWPIAALWEVMFVVNKLLHVILCILLFFSVLGLQCFRKHLECVGHTFVNRMGSQEFVTDDHHQRRRDFINTHPFC